MRHKGFFIFGLVILILASACSSVPPTASLPEGHSSTLAAQTLAARESGDNVTPAPDSVVSDTPMGIQDTQVGSEIMVGESTATLPKAATATPKFTNPPPPPSVTFAPTVDIYGMIETGVPTILPLLTDILTEPNPQVLEVAPEVGALAPDFALVDARTGERVQLSRLEGLPVVINFWATWCGPCVAEMPALEKAYKAHQAEGLVVLAINVQESRNKVKNFGDNLGVSYNLLMDSEGAVTREYRVFSMPTSYFVDRLGVIQAIALGGMDRETIEEYLKTILE